MSWMNKIDNRLKKTVPVTVIIPCYKCSDTVTRAVESIFVQTWLPCEVILVDDGNTDDTTSTLLKIQILYGKEWIKILRLEKNHGQSIARNRAWDIAKGYYIAFLDADDAWDEKKIELQYSIMKNNPRHKISAHGCVVSNKSSNNKNTKPFLVKKIPIWLFLISNKFNTPSVMVRTDIKLRFKPDKRFSEDYLLWMEIIWAEGDGLYIDLPLAFLFKFPYGVSGLSAQLKKMETEELNVFKTLYKRGRISFIATSLAMLVSYTKYLRRKIIVTFGKIE